jgi:hypothetical protein
MDGLNLVFCILCIIAGILTIVGGVLWVAAVQSFVAVVLSIYLIIFGLWMTVSEVFMPGRLMGWVSFYLTWVGKAIWYIFVGVLLLLPYQARVKVSCCRRVR